MKPKTVFQMYLIAAIAFVFALLKYSFWGLYDVSPMYFIFEIFSFMGFLGVVYLSDRFMRLSKADTLEKEKECEYKIAEFREKIIQHELHIDELLNKSGSKINSTTEIEQFKTRINDILNSEALGPKEAMELLDFISKSYEVGLGVCYFKAKPSEKFTVEGVYGLEKEEVVNEFDGKTGINGQCIADREAIVIREIEEEYFNIESCSGSSKPRFLYLLPLCKNKEVVGLLELATFKEIHIENHWELIVAD